MKKIIKILIISMAMFTLAGCDNGDRDGQDEDKPDDGFKQEDTSEKVDNTDDLVGTTEGVYIASSIDEVVVSITYNAITD